MRISTHGIADIGNNGRQISNGNDARTQLPQFGAALREIRSVPIAHYIP
jgi:hypothetical protein